MTGYRPQFRERVGTTLAEKYTLRNLLGVGGMAAVFEAENTWTGRRVAIKLLTADTDTDDDEKATRFMQEARAATRVEHPNIVQVLDMGRDADDGSLFIVEEYLTGQDLRALLDKRHKLPVRTALEIVIPVMDALHAAHAQGVFHRDIKPANIFLARVASGDIFPKVIDFGVVKIASSDGITKTGTTIGTPEYMSPEQAHGDRSIDQQTDVWSTAVVLWEMLAGRCPYQNENYHALLVKIIWEPTPRIETFVPNLPAGLADILHRALERDRKARYPDMRAFLEAILACPGLAKEPWMQALGNAYGGKRTTPGMHDVTGFIAMPSRPAASVSVTLDISDLPEFAPPEAPTIELEAVDVSASSAEHAAAPPENADLYPSLTPPPSTSPSPRPMNKSVVAFAALGIACLLGAALAFRSGGTAAPPTRASHPPAVTVSSASQPHAAPPTPTRPTPVVTPVVAPVAAPPIAPPVAAPPDAPPVVAQTQAHAPVAPAVNPDESPAPDLVFAPSPEPRRGRPHHAAPSPPPPPPPVSHRGAHNAPVTHQAAPAHRGSAAHRSHNGAPILSVP